MAAEFTPFSPSSTRIHTAATDNGWAVHENDMGWIIEYRRGGSEKIRVFYSTRGAWYQGSYSSSTRARRLISIDVVVEYLTRVPGTPHADTKGKK
jgi:hypothetical protein